MCCIEQVVEINHSSPLSICPDRTPPPHPPESNTAPPADTPWLAGGGGSRRSSFGGGEGHKPRLPPQQLDRFARIGPRALGESPARLRVVQAQFPIHRAAHVGVSVSCVLDQGAPLSPLCECAPVRLSAA